MNALHHNVKCAQRVAIYSNTTHFHVGHIDEVIVCSNGDTGDVESTGT